jgi:hypothetical protein
VIYCAADPGTTTNAFAFAAVERILSHSGRALWVIRYLQSWQGRPGKPLDVRNVQGPECCRLAWRFGCDSILTDAHEHAAMVNAGMSWMGDDRWKPTISMPLDAGDLSVITSDLRTVLHDSTGCRVFFGDEIDDATRDEVGKQLASVTYKGDGGKIKIVWPTEGTGHGDEARAVVRALRHGRAGEVVTIDPKPAPVIRAPRTAAYDGFQESAASGWENDRRW